MKKKIESIQAVLALCALILGTVALILCIFSVSVACRLGVASGCLFILVLIPDIFSNTINGMDIGYW